MAADTRYVPAAGRAAFTRLYDPVVALTMRERTFRGALLAQVDAALPQGGTLVDVGAGTGTFALAAARRRPDAQVHGVDGDPQVLAIARAKGTGVRWHQALAQALPLDDASADAVTISLVLHHLERDAKRAALREVRRVLRPGGTLHVADFGRPRDPAMAAAFFAVRCLDGFAPTRDHAHGTLPRLIEEAGFTPPETTRRLRTAGGQLELLRAAALATGRRAAPRGAGRRP